MINRSRIVNDNWISIALLIVLLLATQTYAQSTESTIATQLLPANPSITSTQAQPSTPTATKLTNSKLLTTTSPKITPATSQNLTASQAVLTPLPIDHISNTNTLQSKTPPQPPSINTPSMNPTPTPSNLTAIDNTSANLAALKRKLEVEKTQTELKRIHNEGTNNNLLSLPSENAQTITTGVAINQEGKKIAWLQFADGGSLTVNIGSKVGKYTVRDISMSGVILTQATNQKDKHKHKALFLKRAYYAPTTPKQSGSSSSLGFTPSPIVTDANTHNDMVPPIVPIR